MYDTQTVSESDRGPLHQPAGQHIKARRLHQASGPGQRGGGHLRCGQRSCGHSSLHLPQGHHTGGP